MNEKHFRGKIEEPEQSNQRESKKIPPVAEHNTGETCIRGEKNTKREGMRMDVADARAQMLVAEAQYLRAMRLRATGTRTSAHPDGMRRERVNSLRDIYDQSRVDFSNKVNKSVQARLNESGRGMAFTIQNTAGEDVAEKVPHSQERKDAVERRYNRMVLTRDIVDRAHKRKLEAMQEYERGMFGKVLGWYARANNNMEEKIARSITRGAYDYLPEHEKLQKRKKARTIARGLRILTFASIGGIAGGIAVAGHRGHRSIISIFFGTAVGENVGKHFMRTKGVQRAHELLLAREHTGEATVQSVRNLETAYKKGSPEALEKGRRIRAVLTVALVGGGVSYESAAIVGQLSSVHEAVTHVVHNNISHATPDTSLHTVQNTVPQHSEVIASHATHHGSTTETPITHAEHNVQKQVTTHVSPHVAESATVATGVAALHTTPPVVHDIPAPNVTHTPEVSNHAEAPIAHSHHELNTTQNEIRHSAHNDANHEIQTKASESVAQSQPLPVQGAPTDHIAELLKPNELGKYLHTPISEVLYGNIPLQSKFHSQLVRIVSQSGVGPENNETVEHFLTRAQESITAHVSNTEHLVGMHNLYIPDHQTYLYKTENGDIISFGGSFNARSMIAYEYLSTHPAAHILVENIQGSYAMDISSTSSATGHPILATRPAATPISPAQFVSRVEP